MKYQYLQGLLFFGIVVCFFYPSVIFANSESTLQEEITFLKDDLTLMQDQIEEINLSANNLINISGYTDIEIHNSSESGKKPGFRLHHLSLFFEKTINQKWKFFSEIEYEDAPKFEGSGESQTGAASGEIIEDAKGKLFVEAVNVTYQHKPELNIRAGRFFTPAGIWSVDHYPSFVPTQLRPQHVRKIFPQVIDGVMLYGSIPIGSAFFDYHGYTGNGEGNTGKNDQNSEKSFGLRASMVLAWLSYFEIGVSAYNDTLNDETTKNSSGAHLKIEFADIAFQTEYATATMEPVTGESYQSLGYYAQLAYYHQDSTYGVRYDYFEADDRVLDGGKVYNGVFYNYRVNDSVVMKLEHYNVMFDDNSQVAHVETIGSLVVYLGN